MTKEPKMENEKAETSLEKSSSIGFVLVIAILAIFGYTFGSDLAKTHNRMDEAKAAKIESK